MSARSAISWRPRVFQRRCCVPFKPTHRRRWRSVCCALWKEALPPAASTSQVRSAHLLVVEHESFPLIDLRVDWHDTPIAELRALWQRYEPESNAYLLRALDPENPAIL